MQLRKFTDRGIAAFQEFLENARADGIISEEDRQNLLQNDSYTVPINPDVSIDDSVSFDNRFKAGEYLFRKLGDINNQREAGMWAWLALLFIRHLCVEKGGRRIIGRNERYIPDFANWKLYYRHLLYGPFHIYKEHRTAPGKAMVVLCPPVNKPGDAVEALSSRQHLIANPTVMKAATALYVKDGKHKRGAGRKDRGGTRRFATVLMQFDLTYDLYQISPADLIELLPREFDEFKP